MARCNTCKRTVDREAAVCNHCGRPNPAKMRLGEKIVEGFIAIFILGFLGNQFIFNDGSTPSQAPNSAAVGSPKQEQIPASPATQIEDQATPSMISAASAARPPEIANPDQDAADTSGNNTSPVVTLEQAKAREARPISGATGSDSSYPIRARLIDPRGKVVVQSEASVMARNVETVQAGITVYAARNYGKWVGIKLEDGRTGFVRLKQVEFF